MRLKTSISLEESVLQRLSRIADLTHQSRSEVIEQMILENLDFKEQFALALADPAGRRLLEKQLADPELMRVVAAMAGKKKLPETQRLVERFEQVAADIRKPQKKKGSGK
jgi:hypothetical protein